jgi:beta-glucosidase-like glycosyl hydrolase
MKAIARDYTVPDAAVLAIEAGCDGVLICSGDWQAQGAAIEALIHAVEDQRLSLTLVDDALRRQELAKERFLLKRPSRPVTAMTLRQTLGRDEHRAIADEMARFA